MSDELIDHGNLNVLKDELDKPIPEIACNVIVLLKSLTDQIKVLENRITTLEVKSI